MHKCFVNMCTKVQKGHVTTYNFAYVYMFAFNITKQSVCYVLLSMCNA